MAVDLPRITESAHAHSTYSMGNMATAIGNFGGTTGGIAMNQFAGRSVPAATILGEPTGLLMPRRMGAGVGLKAIIDKHFPEEPAKEHPMAAAPTRRIVQVFIADPDENIPLEKSLLYTGTQKLTDATDQELYFEIDIKTILEKHNEMRVKLVNKKVKERVENLEPARVRDLRMSVITVASF